MEFRAWIETNEGMWDWLKKQGRNISQWSPVNPQTIGTYPGEYVQEPKKAGRALGQVKPQSLAQVKPQFGDDRAYGAKLYGQMARQGQAAQAQLQQPQRAKFTAEDLRSVQAAVTDYLGLVKKFYSKVKEELGKTEQGPQAVQFAQGVFNQHIKEHYERLMAWMKWINDMISWLPKRESVEEENELITEAIKVNYKNFEQLAGSIRALTQAMSGWIDALGQRTGRHFMRWAKNLFVQTVAAKQSNLDAQFMKLVNKIKELMNIHGREYGKLPQASAAQYPQPGYPAGTRSAFA